MSVNCQGLCKTPSGNVDPVRSRNMAAIRGKDTKPEMHVRQRLHRLGFRFRLHDRSLPGNPDLKLSRYNAVVFVHGCYWHRHKGCKYATTPATNREFWVTKLNGNAERDREHIQKLGDLGWRVAVVWECALRPQSIKQIDPLRSLADWLVSDQPLISIPCKPLEKPH